MGFLDCNGLPTIDLCREAVLHWSPMTSLIPITPNRFASRAWKPSQGYGFAATSHMVPVVAAELPKLVPDFPLAFVGRDQRFELVALLSLQPETNAFVAHDGRWLGSHVPAAIRKYPFRLARPEGQASNVLCIDEDSNLITEPGAGEPFFDEKGQPAKGIRDVLDFLGKVEKSRVATQAAVDALQAARLIQPWLLRVTNAEHTVPVEGLARVDETALNGLPDDAWLTLRRANALPVAYGQLLSMNQVRLIPKVWDLREQISQSADTRQTRPQDVGLKLGDDDTLSFGW